MATSLLIAIGTSKNIALNQWGTLWVKMDTSGTIIQQNLLLDSMDGFFAFNQNYPLTLDDEDNVALVGNVLNRSSIFFQKINKNGEQLVFKEFEHPDNAQMTLPKSILKVAGGYLILSSVQLLNFKTQLDLLRVDENGEIIFRKQLGLPAVNETPGSILQTGPDSFVIGGLREAGNAPGTNGVMQCQQNWIFGIDGAGNVQWQWLGEPCSSSNVYGLQQTDDGGYVYTTGELEVFNPWNWGFKPKLVRRDADLNLVWKRDLGQNHTAAQYFYSLTNHEDSFISAGRLCFPEPCNPLTGSDGGGGCFYKIDVNGDSIWRTCIFLPLVNGNETLLERLGGLVTLPSGSSIAVGTFTENTGNGGKSWAWVVKVDAQGCLEPDCNVVGTALPPRDEGGVRVFPNPARGDLQIEFSQPATGNLELLSAIGQVVRRRELLSQRQHSLPVADLPRGIYFLRVTDGGGQLLHLENVVLR